MSLTVLPVYVSSTWLDLQPERKAVEQAVQRLRETKFVGMEYFGSRDEATRQASLDDVDRSSAYVLLIAGRYGSGITEAEYERACELGLPRLVYFKDDATIPDNWRETEPEQLAKLDAFKKKLRDNHLQAFDFTTPDDLAAKLTADLHRWLFDEYLTPKLQAALRNEVPRKDAQALLDTVRDLSALSRDLLSKLQGAGFNVASGERSAAVSGDKNRVVTGDSNVLAENVAGDVVQGDKIVHEAPRPIIPTLHQLRAPVGDFVGREKEIEQLLATLRGGASAAISGISGMGGIGKTELAFYVAERLRDVYTDAQLVVDMRGTDDTPRDAGDALAACIRAFVGLEQRLPDDLQELTRIYRSVLEGKRALILLDNARDSAQARPLMPPAGSALLVTSRETVALPGMRRITLEQLEPAEARELLRGIAPHVPADTADRICFLCGYLPLAIRAAGSLLDITRDLAPNAYAEQLQDERTRLENIGAEGVDISVEASFGLSYARLTSDAARVFRQLAAFPASFDARAEETICEDPGHKQLSDLLRRNLVIYNPDTQRYRLHDLARLFASVRLSETERYAVQKQHARHYLDILEEARQLYMKGGDGLKKGLQLFAREWENIQAGQVWAAAHLEEDKDAASLCSSYPATGWHLFEVQQEPHERLSLAIAGLNAAQRLKDRVAEAGHLGNIGLLYHALGESSRAADFHEKALIIQRELGNRVGEGAALCSLGMAYSYSDETHRAIQCFEQALVISREIGDRRNEGVSLGNMGIAYFRLGDTRRALESFEQDLAISREVGDLYREGLALNNLSLAFYTIGDFTQAHKHALDAVEIFEQIGSPHAEKVRALLARWRREG